MVAFVASWIPLTPGFAHAVSFPYLFFFVFMYACATTNENIMRIGHINEFHRNGCFAFVLS